MESTTAASTDSISLLSNDGARLPLPRAVACQSRVLASSLGAAGTPFRATAEVSLPFAAAVVQAVCDYLLWRHTHTGSALPPPEFPVPPEIALDLLAAADFLEL